MKITFYDNILVLFKVWACLPLLPFKYKFYIILKPLESTRYLEFAYLIKFFKEKNFLSFGYILDVSSPYMMAYILSKKNKVIKTDISNEESKFIRNSKNLCFKQQDGTRLSYNDNAFDLVYSISVIEHIYGKYIEAVKEMLRVTKVNGFIYLSIPVSKEFIEEWINDDIYSDQFKNGDKIFFQYRFCKYKIEELLNSIGEIKIIKKDIYWERKDGTYDKMILKIRKKYRSKILNFIREAFINLYYGFSIFNSKPEGFDKAKSFGNISIIIQKTGNWVQR